MTSSRVPPWLYTVVVVACVLGTFGTLKLLGVLDDDAPPPGTPPASNSAAPPAAPTNAIEPRSPVDPATLPPHRAARRTAAVAALLPVYDAAGSDGPGRAAGRWALEAYALYLAHAHPPDTLGEHVRAALTRSRNSGCTDPLVRYAEWRLTVDVADGNRHLENGVRAAEEFGRTKYPAVLRARAYLDAALHYPDAFTVPAAERYALGLRLTEGFWSAFAEAAADPDPAAVADLLDVARELVGRDDPLGGDRHANYARARAALEAAEAPEYVRLTLDGLAAARDGAARLGALPGAAGRVAKAEARPHFERAATALDRAWELNPKCRVAPTELITVAFELGRGPDEVRRWHERATAADPDNARAWANELSTLGPDRGGTVEDLVAFARRCREAKNWNGGLGPVAADALEAARRHRPKLLADPAVWAEAKALFDAWLAAQPESRAARSFYARAACTVERYDIACPLFEALDGRPWPAAYPDPRTYTEEFLLSQRGTGRAPAAPGRWPANDWTGTQLLSNRAARTATRAARREWFSRTYRDAFARLHPADGPGHAEGLAALAAAADAEAARFPVGRPADAAWNALAKAVAAGCDDPLVRALHARFGRAAGETLEDKAAPERTRKAVADLLASEYPDAAKFGVAFDDALAALSDGAGEFRKRLTALAPVFGRCAAEPDPVVRSDALRSACALLDAADGRPGARRREIHTALAAALAEAKADPYPGLVLDGVVRTAAAWESFPVFGGGERPASFVKGLREAEQLLARAWRLTPDRVEAPTRMLTVGTGLGYPRPEFNRWFARAVAPDPDNYDAVRRLSRYLEPGWHGSRNGIDLLSVRSLTYAAAQWEGPFGLMAYEAESAARYVYMGARSDDPRIWAEVAYPLQTWLKADPDCRFAKTVYALAAVRAGQHATAAKLFHELRGRPWPGVFPSAEAYREAVEAARRATGAPRVD